MPHDIDIDLHEIFECAHLKLYAKWSVQESKQTYTHMCNEVLLVWGLLSACTH